MRPTDLGFRSPKEKTAEIAFPKLTNNGNALLEIRANDKHPSFSKSKRFDQYESEAKKTGFRVGPGSYKNKSLATDRIKGGCVYKPFHRDADFSSNGYFFVGNRLMFDASFLIPSKKHKQQEISNTVDLCELRGDSTVSRSSTLKTTLRKRKNSIKRLFPSFEHFSVTMKFR